MPNTKKIAPSLQVNDAAPLSHETATLLKEISISLFDGGETPKDRNEGVWTLLNHAMLSPEADNNIERANMVELCNLHAKFNDILFSIYNSHQQQEKEVNEEIKIFSKSHPLDIHLNKNVAKEINGGSFFIDYRLHKEEIINKKISGDFDFEIKTLIIFNCPKKQINILKEILSTQMVFSFRKLYAKEFIEQPIRSIIVFPAKININELTEATPS